MKRYSQKDLINALKDVGLVAGDVVIVSTKFFSLGKMIEGHTKEEFLSKILEAFFEVLSEEGTLVAHTYSTQTARFGRPFIYEKTKCINGAFCQFVLEHPESVRSLHPINSFAAIGKKKQEICLNTSSSNYGLDSPPDRMLKLDANLVMIGLEFYRSLYLHFLETHCCVPYCYNKLLDIPVYKEGSQLSQQFTANVRYLEYDIEYDMDSMRNALIQRGCVKTVTVGEGEIHSLSAREYCDVGLGVLSKDPFAFLKRKPNFEKGKIPYDGITSGRGDAVSGEGKGIYDI